MSDAGLTIEGEMCERTGCFIGSGMGGLATIEATQKSFLERAAPRHLALLATQLIINLAAGHLAMKYNAKGPSYAQVSACSSGANAIGDGYRAISTRRGRRDDLRGNRGRGHSPRGGWFSAPCTPCPRANDAPAEACRPFDLGRDGFLIAEGAGVLILEERERAKKRGAHLYAELSGYGANTDAFHVTAPAPEGEGAQRCMRLALKDARLAPADIEYINAHGTSTKLNDATETWAIKKVFGDHAGRLMVSSTSP